jgi:iron complex outermembrane receptor protein
VKQKTLVTAIKRAIGAEILISAAFATAAFGQAAPATGASAPMAASSAKSGGVTQLQKVEVTGSLIRSSDKVGYNQVQTVTAAQIQASGQTTVADFLRSTSANSASSWSEGNPDSFAPGGAGIALRGLSEKYTLVLVDGQRVAPYGFSVNGTDSFFDLNTIPLNMVDRIEIVKTGAVSQYGSDAIAGVVNIITKKNFQGLQLDGALGGATEGGAGETKLGLTAGFGDLNSDKFNVTLGASFFKSNDYTLDQRSDTKGQSGLGYNSAYGTLNGPAYYGEPFGVGNGTVPFGTCPYGSQVVNGGLLNAAPEGGGNVCAGNNANVLYGQPTEIRANVKLHATFQLNDTTQAFADFWESRNTTTLNQYPAGIGDGTSAYNPATGGVTQVSNILSGSNPYNPFGTDTPITYTFPNAEQVKTTANFFRASTGLKGTYTLPYVGDWDWSASVSHSQSTVDNTENNLLSVSGLENILGPNGAFDFNNPAATPNGLAGLYMSGSDEAISKLDSLDLTTSTSDLFSLPAGDVGLGLGAQFLHESQYISNIGPDALGLTTPFGIQTVQGERNVAAAFYQVDIPIISGVSFSQSGRYDHYSDFGGAFSPRFALRWQPSKLLTTYASYSRGFRAPTLVENSQSASYGYQYAADPYSPVSTSGQYYPELTKGNPDLQPERTKNYNIGFQLSPNSTTDFGLDWYRIQIDHVIGVTDLQDLINTNDPTIVERNPDGTIAYVNTTYANLGSLRTDGFEATFRKSVPTKYGTFTLSGDWAYVWHFNVEAADGTTDYNCAGNNQCIQQPFGASNPRWKGNLDLAWAYQKFNTDLSYQYSSPYTDALYPGDSVASYSQFNLTTTYTGIKHWTLYATLDNIFNRMPPFDPIWQGATSNGLGYDPSLYNNLGRFIEVGASYRF